MGNEKRLNCTGAFLFFVSQLSEIVRLSKLCQVGVGSCCRVCQANLCDKLCDKDV